MGTSKKPGKAGARSVSNRCPSTPNERGPGLAEAKEAFESARLSVRNEETRGLALLAPGGDLNSHIAALPSFQLEAVANSYGSAVVGHVMAMEVLGRLVAHADAKQLEDGDFSTIGFMVISLAQRAECDHDLAEFARYAISKRKGGEL